MGSLAHQRGLASLTRGLSSSSLVAGQSENDAASFDQGVRLRQHALAGCKLCIAGW